MFVQMPSWHTFPASHSSTSVRHREVSEDQAPWAPAFVTVFPLLPICLEHKAKTQGASTLLPHKNYAWVTKDSILTSVNGSLWPACWSSPMQLRPSGAGSYPWAHVQR